MSRFHQFIVFGFAVAVVTLPLVGCGPSDGTTLIPAAEEAPMSADEAAEMEKQRQAAMREDPRGVNVGTAGDGQASSPDGI